jgi:succinoglycan biosynthesis protein ExoL
MRVLVLGHDAADAALAKRVGQMRGEGHEVRVMSFRRGGAAPLVGSDGELGRTEDGAFARRLAAIPGAARRVRRSGLEEAEIVWARNLDPALVALGALPGRSLPLVYEALDVHELLSGEGPLSLAARAAERAVLRRASLLVTSSPGFVREHFAPRYGEVPVAVIENRMSLQGLPPRPGPRAPQGVPVIGWFGILRCARSLALLRQVAAAGLARVVLRGRPSAALRGPVEAAAREGPVRFGGAYAPSDLAALYGAVDLAWAGDWSQAGANSDWLLPNRLYEAGWFGVPVLAPGGTETARWAAEHGTGFVLDGPTEEALPRLLADLTPDAIRDASARVLAAPGSLFAAPPGEVAAALREAAS